MGQLRINGGQRRERSRNPRVGLVPLLQKASHIRLTFTISPSFTLQLPFPALCVLVPLHGTRKCLPELPYSPLVTWIRSAMLVGRNVPRTAPLGASEAEDDKPYLGLQRSSLTDLAAAKSRVPTPPLPCTSMTANHPFSCVGKFTVTYSHGARRTSRETIFFSLSVC